MSVKYGKFEMPENISIDESLATPTFAKFIAEPFERGYGHTLGNFLRRVLLTSLEAPAIISVSIEGIPHEYMVVEGIIEDMTDIVLNIKGALIRKLPLENDSLARLNRIITSVVDITQADLDKHKGQVRVCLGDVLNDGNFEVINPELHLFTVTKPMKKIVNFKIGFGRGYVPSERHEVSDKSEDEILVDSAFSPVLNVNYYVENTRVGQDTDFDKLILEVTTDGRIDPVEAISFASQIGVKHFKVFDNYQKHALVYDEGIEIGDTDYDEIMQKLSLKIDEIELSVRSTNCLSSAKIETIAELVTIPESKMLKFRNFGKKSLNEIKAKLFEMHLSLGMDLSKYGITHENVREKIKIFCEEKSSRDQADDIEE